MRSITVAMVSILHFTGHNPRSYDLLKDQHIWLAGFNLDLDYCPSWLIYFLSLQTVSECVFSVLAVILIAISCSQRLIIANTAGKRMLGLLGLKKNKKYKTTKTNTQLRGILVDIEFF